MYTWGKMCSHHQYHIHWLMQTLVVRIFMRIVNMLERGYPSHSESVCGGPNKNPKANASAQLSFFSAGIWLISAVPQTSNTHTHTHIFIYTVCIHTHTHTHTLSRSLSLSLHHIIHLTALLKNLFHLLHLLFYCSVYGLIHIQMFTNIFKIQYKYFLLLGWVQLQTGSNQHHIPKGKRTDIL